MQVHDVEGAKEPEGGEGEIGGGGALEARTRAGMSFMRYQDTWSLSSLFDLPQVDGFLIALRKGPHAMRVVEAWLELCQDYEVCCSGLSLDVPEGGCCAFSRLIL